MGKRTVIALSARERVPTMTEGIFPGTLIPVQGRGDQCLPLQLQRQKKEQLTRSNEESLLNYATGDLPWDEWFFFQDIFHS